MVVRVVGALGARGFRCAVPAAVSAVNNTPPRHYSGASWDHYERKKRPREDDGEDVGSARTEGGPPTRGGPRGA
eukprot:2258070-Prymnesium_polylepis.1